MKDFWKTKLTPWDSELAMMVQSLTERPCEMRNGGDGYFFEANYEAHQDPEYIAAMMEAIEGRAGQRLIEIKDDPDRKCLIVHVAFSTESLPCLERKEISQPSPAEGRYYIDDYGYVISALQVKRNGGRRLLKFVGNGEMEIPDDGPAVFHFLNADGSVFAHATEGQYIIFQRYTHFLVMDAEQFESEYHLFE